jgi:hypothetical protein
VKRTTAIGGSLFAGLVVGALLHFAFGLRVFPASPRPAPAGPTPAGGARAPGALEAERQASLRETRIRELRERLAAAEAERKELEARVAAAAARAPREETPADKRRRFGRVMGKMLKVSVSETQGRLVLADNPEQAQKLMGELFGLAKELGINLNDSSSFYSNPELLAGLFEGLLDEFEIPLDDAARAELQAAVASRLSAPAEGGSGLRSTLGAMQVTGDILERFGARLADRSPGLPAQLANFGASMTLSTSEASAERAAQMVHEDVRKAGKLSEAEAARLRPLADAWARDYAALLEDARRGLGAAAVEAALGGSADPKAGAPGLAAVREGLSLKARLVELEARMLESMAREVSPEAARRLLKFAKVYYFPKLGAR